MYSPKAIASTSIARKVSTLLVVMCLALVSATAQTSESPAYKQKASFDENMTLVLPQADVLPSAYTVDISNFKFSDRATATTYFNSISDNLVHFKLDESGESVTVRLQYANTGTKVWSLEDWTTYLTEKQARYSDYYARMVK
jgi:hypothetical protein